MLPDRVLLIVKPVLNSSLHRYMSHLDIDQCVCQEHSDSGKLDLN